MTATDAPSPQPPAPAVLPIRTAGIGPKASTALWVEYRLILRSVATKGRIAAVTALAGIAVITGVAKHASNPYHSLDAGVGFASNMLLYIVPVAVLVFGAATIGDLVDDGSLVYLWLRPVATWVHVVAAWAATVTITVPLVIVPIVLSTAVIDSTNALLVGTIGGGLVAVAAYAALFVTAGIRFRRALPWGLVYILIWEGFVAAAGKGAAKLAVRSYVASILARETDIKIKLANFTMASAIIVPLVAAVVCLAYASRRLARSDVA